MCKSPPPPLFILEIRENSKSESQRFLLCHTLGRGQLGHFIALGRGEILNFVEVSSESRDQKSEREDNYKNYKDRVIYNGITEWVNLETDLGAKISNKICTFFCPGNLYF